MKSPKFLFQIFTIVPKNPNISEKNASVKFKFTEVGSVRPSYKWASQ